MSYRVAWVLLVALLSVSWIRPAFAADPAADALFTSAKALMDEGKYAEACPKFEESYRLDPLLGVLLNLAFCLEQEGRVASSWTRWGEASEIAARAGDERKSYADEHRAATEARLAKLRIVVVGTAQDLKIYRNAAPVRVATLGTELPVDPGDYLIEVARGDALLHQETASIGEAESKTVTLDLSEIAKKPAAGRRRGAGDAPPPPSVRTLQPAGRQTGFVVAGAVIGSFGVAAGVVGAVFGGLALSKVDETSDPTVCTISKVCTQPGLDIVSEAEGFSHASTGLLIGGGVLATVGLVLILAAPSDETVSERAARPPRVTFMPLERGAALQLDLEFR